MAFKKRRVWDSQPQEGIDLDWLNPITQGLVFAVIGNSPDLVSGTPPTLLGGASFRPNALGIGVESASTSADGVYYVLPAGSPLYSIGSQSTIAMNVAIDAWTSYSTFLCVPYRAGSWTSPYSAFQLSRGAATDELNFQYSESSSPGIAGVSTTFSLTTDGLSRFLAASRNGTSLLLQSDDLTQTVSMSASSVVDFTNRQPVVLLNHSNSSTGEGVDGRSVFAYVWNRPLSSDELAEVRARPWSIVRPRSIWIPVSAGGGPPPTFIPSWARRQSRTIGAGVI